MVEKKVDIQILRENILKLKNASEKGAHKRLNCQNNRKKTRKIGKKRCKSPKFCAVVKANAYGHGYKEVCTGIADLVDFFAVANATEALQVRALKLRKHILMLGKFDESDLPNLIKRGIRLTVDTFQDVEKIISVATELNKKAYVHIKVNTGMNRLGVKTNLQLKTLLDKISQCENIIIEGIYTHFATAENNNSYKLKKQNAKFLFMLNLLRNKKVIVHASNSCAFLKSNKYSYDMVRVGLAMYGYDNTNKLNLKPCLQVRAKIVKTQTLQKGESVGYDASFVAPNQMQIAVVAIGYADGFVRAYEKGYVLISGQKCPIVGHICMDMLMCDITGLKIQTTYTCGSVLDGVATRLCDSMNIVRTVDDDILMSSFKSMIDKAFPCNYNLHKIINDLDGVIPNAQSYATVIGGDGDEKITACDLAKLSNTIEYEVLTNFNLLRT